MNLSLKFKIYIMEKLTLHRILSELKTIDSRIDKATESLIPMAVKRGKSLIINGRSSNKSEDEFTDEAKSSLQSVNDLIKRKFVLKSALMKANSSTIVNIGGIDYTITEAIEMKSQMTLRKNLLTQLKRFNIATDKVFSDIVEKVDSDFERMLTTQISGLTNKSDIAKVRDEYHSVFYAQNEVKLIDPIDVNKVIKALEAEIDEFLVNVDSALSEINATTVIEIE